MSEYQYYEFLAVEKSLTNEQQEEVSSISSRAYVNSSRARFVYNYGDFRGDVKQLMNDFFDVMIYISSWGSRRLLLKFPLSLVDMNQVAQYCVSDKIDHWKAHNNVILDLNFYDEERAEWIDGEGWIDQFQRIREEIIADNYISLYLVWLKTAANVLSADEIDEEIIEPPVPSGLKQLTPSQKMLIEFFDIDNDVIAVAAQNSHDKHDIVDKLEEYIDVLSDEEKSQYLTKMLHGDGNVPFLLRKHLQEIHASSGREEQKPEKRRKLRSILTDAEQRKAQRIKLKKQWDRIEYENRLRQFATHQNESWLEVYRLIEEKRPQSYDKSISLLSKLKELAEFTHDWNLFNENITNIISRYSRLSSLMAKIRENNLVRK